MPKFYYGGQAVMEGVMMRGRQSVAVAIRRPEGDMYVYEEALNSKLYRSKVFRLPFLRGILVLWEMLVLGTRMMTLSANIAFGAASRDAAGTSQTDEVNVQSQSEAGSDVIPQTADTSEKETPQLG